MIRKYIRERLSWIVLVLSMQMLLLFVAAIDRDIPFKPVLYIVFLLLLLFAIFLLLRYSRETRFYQNLLAWDGNNEPEGHLAPRLPMEALVMDQLSKYTEEFRQQNYKLVAQLEEEKDELMSWIHEIKTPLTTMQIMIDRLGDEALKSQLRYEWLHVHLLLDRQLHQKRIRFIENDLYIERISLESLLFKEIKELQAWCMQKGVGINVSLSVKEVTTDAKWLSFILRQLLSNAVKYSKEADIDIATDISQDGLILLRITDSGRGIDSRDLPRIFEKGFTSTLEHQNQAATGMGLYLAKKAADSLLIRLEAESKLGQGSVFTLYFPRSNALLEILGM